jgi:hypothetical protein
MQLASYTYVTSSVRSQGHGRTLLWPRLMCRGLLGGLSRCIPPLLYIRVVPVTLELLCKMKIQEGGSCNANVLHGLQEPRAAFPYSWLLSTAKNSIYVRLPSRRAAVTSLHCAPVRNTARKLLYKDRSSTWVFCISCNRLDVVIAHWSIHIPSYKRYITRKDRCPRNGNLGSSNASICGTIPLPRHGSNVLHTPCSALLWRRIYTYFRS